MSLFEKIPNEGQSAFWNLERSRSTEGMSSFVEHEARIAEPLVLTAHNANRAFGQRYEDPSPGGSNGKPRSGGALLPKESPKLHYLSFNPQRFYELLERQFLHSGSTPPSGHDTLK